MNDLSLIICALLIAAPSFADARVQLAEGDPNERFIISKGRCTVIGPSELVIGFAASSAGPIFDVTGSCAGGEVVQPFTVTEGATLVDSSPILARDTRSATLLIEILGAAQKIAFTIDVDDASDACEITVSDGKSVSVMVPLSAQGKHILAQMGFKTDACRS